jgi:hypothetical protein|nr:MAG TPA: Head Tail Connector Protein [Caudoviricetes sp.]
MIEEFKQLSGESDEKILSLLWLRAKNIVLAETNRTILIPGLESVTLEIALELYNRSGVEGESSRSEGGISTSYRDDFSPHIKNTLSTYRLARCSGGTFEKK